SSNSLHQSPAHPPYLHSFPTRRSSDLKGRDITHVKGKALRDIYRSLQMVFQSPAASFDPRRTLGDGIGESLRNCGMGKARRDEADRKSTRLNSSHVSISYAVFCLKKKK